ncbi:MAG: sulfatase-like hydrolase/transferase [Candidatus Hydrogenedentota bacterium]
MHSHSVNRRTFLGTTGLGLAALAGIRSATARNGVSRKPNILLIMADDVGYECIGVNGGESYQTPRIDAMAEEGMRFEYAYSTPKCVPSRVTLLTGRYAHRTGYTWGKLPEPEVTVAQCLRKAGYATAVAGKWQLNLMKNDPSYPHEKGFDEYCLWAWHEGPRYYYPWIWQNGKLLKEEVKDRYGPDVYCEFLVDFMRRNREQPFFAYFPMTLAHFPKKDEPPGPEGHKTYGEMIAYMDLLVGRLIDALDEMELRDNTLIIFTGDNGSPRSVTSRFRGKAIRGGKSLLTDAGTHAAFYANWLGTISPGSRTNDLVDFTDFMPTFAELGGADLPKDRVIDGVSFAPRLLRNETNGREWVFTEWKGKYWARDRRWKLYGNGAFFDMRADPEENHPLFDEDLSDEAKQARAKLHDAIKSVEVEAALAAHSK